MSVKTVIIIVGPTAVGKTQLAVNLARYYGTEVISADSRQCYKELNIGVAKPTPEEQKGIHHHFIGSHSINDTLNAAEFEKFALSKLCELFEHRNIAVVVGGTGLYIKALMYGFDNIPEVPESIRRSVQDLYKNEGLAGLKVAIELEDPLFAKEGEMLNPQRMMRALEVKRASGYSIRDFQQSQQTKRNFRMIEIGLELSRDELYSKINRRVDTMIQAGLLEEVKALYPFRQLNALQTVGYKELFDYLDGKMVLQEAIEKIKQNTRHYAKRQLTWFKADPQITWFAPDEEEKVIGFLQQEIGDSNGKSPGG